MIKKKYHFRELVEWNFRKVKNRTKGHGIQGSMKKSLLIFRWYSLLKQGDIPPNLNLRTTYVRTYSKETVSNAFVLSEKTKSLSFSAELLILG